MSPISALSLPGRGKDREGESLISPSLQSEVENFTPYLTYINAELEKKSIITNNVEKSGIYR
jgi:hypothetical protein